MIDAYYSLGSDSKDLFADTEIARKEGYTKHLNKYNVIHLDIASFWDDYKENIVDKINECICKDFQEVYGKQIGYDHKLSFVLLEVYQLTRIPFVIIIDEWDCIIRNSDDQELIHRYLQFLHSLFKSEESRSFLALAYMTGILPIKKIKDESALNNFHEFTMLSSKQITESIGT